MTFVFRKRIRQLGSESRSFTLMPQEGCCAVAAETLWWRVLTQLAQQVDQDEEVGQEAPAVPGGVDVLALLPPLEPHADPVLQEGADQAEAGHMGEVVLGDSQKLQVKGRKPDQTDQREGPHGGGVERLS